MQINDNANRNLYASSAGFCAAACLLAVVSAGCGGQSSAGPDRPVTVWTGSVSVDGEPIEIGTIRFVPLGSGGQASPTQAQIVDGKYEIADVPLGKVLVTFSACREKGGTQQAEEHGRMSLPVIESIIPRKYNDGIEVEIGAETKVHDFALTSD